MSTYAVLIVLGQTVASIGSWPGGIEACRSSLPEANQRIDAAFADPKKLAGMRQQWPGLQRDQLNWSCIESATKPEIKDAVPMPRTGGETD